MESVKFLKRELVGDLNYRVSKRKKKKEKRKKLVSICSPTTY